MGVLFDPAEDLDATLLRGVRCLFVDLHLVEGIASTDHRRHFATIAGILETSISESGGPFVLVVWTEHQQLSSDLRAYLDENLDPGKPHARPLAVLSLGKDQFIDVESGDVHNPAELREAILGKINEIPQLAALLGWEADVLGASAETLASLLSLVPAGQRYGTRFPAALDTVLSRLAREAVGPTNVGTDRRAAISAALAPILADRIINQDIAPDVRETWRHAVTRYDDDDLDDATAEEAGEINRMLHIALPANETINPTDWGSVVGWPYERTDAGFQEHTGLTLRQMFCEEFKLRSRAIGTCNPVLVRIGAACDYAQNNRGPITFLFGIEIPEDAEKQNGATLGNAIWQSPIFCSPISSSPSRLYVHIRFPKSVLSTECANWTAHYRLREQLLMHLIHTSSTYVSRPGTVQLPSA